MTPRTSHAQTTINLHLLTPLKKQVDGFLIACQVDGLSPATIKNYRYHLSRFTEYCLKNNLTDTSAIQVRDIRGFILLLKETNNPTSISDYRKTIKRYFNWLIEEGLLKPEDNPLQNIKPPRKEYKVIVPLSPQDIDRLIDVTSGHRLIDVRNRAIVLSFLDTGVRLSELAGMNIPDIDFNHESVKVMGKGAKERRVRIGKRTQKALLRYLLMRDKVATSKLWVSEEQMPLTAAGVQTTIKTLFNRATIVGPKRGPHTFRHTFAINFLRNGGDVFSLQIILGHTTLTMTRRYVSSLGMDDAFIAHQKASPVDNLKGMV